MTQAPQPLYGHDNVGQVDETEHGNYSDGSKPLSISEIVGRYHEREYEKRQIEGREEDCQPLLNHPFGEPAVSYSIHSVLGIDVVLGLLLGFSDYVKALCVSFPHFASYASPNTFRKSTVILAVAPQRSSPS